MTTVLLSERAVAAIEAQGELAYPEECCGLLIGIPVGENSRRITCIRPVANQTDDDRTLRFMIPVEELLRTEAELGSGAAAILGFYHSHPDHPPRPSEFDRAQAWPWYSYLVLAVEHGRAAALGGFELDPESRSFRSLALATLPSPEGPDWTTPEEVAP